MVNLHRTSLLNSLLIITIILLTQVQCSDLHADPITSYLTDKSGRFIFYHGVNVVYKEFPYYPNRDRFDPMDSLVAQDFKKLSDWGFRSIRLYIAWEGFQPKQGQYNYTYLEKLRQIVRQANKYDISVLIDAHQDLYSRKFCGEGFPDWIVATTTFPAPLKVTLKYDENGIPLKSECMKIQFFKYYETDDVLRFSHDFFSNKNGMADKFIKMWVSVVGFFKGEANVLGYDLINEPSGANFRKNPYDFFAPGVNNNKFLLPFYKRLAKAIRQVDESALLFFQPCVADYIGGFYQSPSGAALAHKDILSYHTYCPFKNEHNEPSSQKKCKLIDEYYMAQRIKNVKKLKCGSSMTEFGSVPETQKGLAEVRRVLRLADNNWQSWFWWQYKYNNDSTCSTNPPWEHSLYYPNGTLQSNKVFALTYPYAYAVCGTPLTQQSSLNTYILSFVPGKCGQSLTQIYLNEKMYFAKGFTISFSPACADCLLQNYRSNYYRLIVPDTHRGRKLQLRVAGYI